MFNVLMCIATVNALTYVLLGDSQMLRTSYELHSLLGNCRLIKEGDRCRGHYEMLGVGADFPPPVPVRTLELKTCIEGCLPKVLQPP